MALADRAGVDSKSSETLPLIPTPASRRNTILAALSALLYVAALGMVVTYPSPACVDMLKPGSRFVDISAEQIAWIASLPALSGIIGNALSGYLSLKLGRRAVLILISTSYTFSWLVIAYAPFVQAVYAGRFMSGLCAGICNVAVPAYIVEISTVEVRGLLTAGYQVAFSAGVLLSLALGAVLRWSWLAVSGAVIVVCSAALMSVMPESPLWLIRESRYMEAMQGLIFFKGRERMAVKEFREIIDHQSSEPRGGISIQELLKPTLYKPVLIAVMLMFFEQFSGISALMAYSVEIFENTVSSLDSSLSAIVVAIVQLVASGFSSIFMDRAGRKILYIVSGACMSVSLAVNGAYAWLSELYEDDEFAGWNWIPLLCFGICIAAFAIGFGPIPFVVTPEMVPTHSRSFVLAVASVSGSLFGFLSTKTFSKLRTLLGLAGLYWMYAVIALAGLLFYCIFVPETKGRSIRDINESFSSSPRK